jgi:hypothetical protein
MVHLALFSYRAIFLKDHRTVALNKQSCYSPFQHRIAEKFLKMTAFGGHEEEKKKNKEKSKTKDQGI